MNIEILGIHYANKGAMLMLEAICAKLREAFPEAKLAVPISMPTNVRLQYGLWGTFPRERGRFDLAGFVEIVPGKVRRVAGIFAPSEIDAVLDASGFGYGDYWGQLKLDRRLRKPLLRWKRGHKKAILLPQALGPFTAPQMQDAFRDVLRCADIVFARDRQSVAYLNALGPLPASVRLAPDFTNLLHPSLPQRLSHLVDKALLVPNKRVIKGGEVERKKYLDFLVLAAEMLRKDGREVFIVVHEGAADRLIADQVNARMPAPINIIDEPSPLVTKAVLGNASLVVSSRYHALVSALSAGVPALACGWSHKYVELMSDYGCEEKVVDVTAPETWRDRIESFLESARTPGFRDALAAAASSERARSEKMWQECFAILRGAM